MYENRMPIRLQSNCWSKEVNLRSIQSFLYIQLFIYFFSIFFSSRCDRAPVVCKYGEMECLRQPSKIFYSYTSISHQATVPMRIFTTRVNTYSRRIKVKSDFKVIDSKGVQLREDQFVVKQSDPNTFDIFLLEQCKVSEKFSMELKIEFFNEYQFQSCLLNKVFLFIV